MKGGQLQIGRLNSPLPRQVTAEIVFISMHTHSPSSRDFQHQLGLISMGGELEIVGQPVERIVKFNGNLLVGTSRISGIKGAALAGSILAKGWAQGDEVLLPATRFERSRRLGNETRTLSAISGQRIIFDSPLEYSHKRVLGRPLTMANLSSNIVIRSAVPDEINQRGQVMVMKNDVNGQCGQTTISGVRFQSLGRTDKARRLSARNQNMMYGVHFHLCGTSPDRTAHVVQDSVLVDSPGWGFVNHGSEVSFSGNVAYDFTGAGFVAEAGHERGEFIGNLAVGGRGVDRYPFRRIYLSEKPRIVRADLAFHGDGFWISSPFVTVSSNRAIGNHGHGFLWYQTGIDSSFVGQDMAAGELSRTVSPDFLSAAELSSLGYRTPKRYWTAAPNRLRISDLPLFQAIRDNYSAANFIGLRVRYTRHFNAAFLNAFYPGGRSTDDFSGGSKNRGAVFPGSSSLRNTVLQNNEIGLHTSYSTRLEFDGLRIEADDQLVRGPAPSARNFELEAATGIEMNHNSNSQHLLRNVRVVGYPIGERRSPNDDEVRARVRVNLVNCDEPFITWDTDTIKRNRR